MNLNSIFNLFNSEDNSVDETLLLVDFSTHPIFWISGFNKIINNHLFFKNYTVKTFKTSSPELNEEDLQRAGQEFMFRRAWDYIKDIDVSKSFHIECLKSKATKSFVYNLQSTIYFFENSEEYEKCALLKKIEEVVESFLT
jgi:hypothetical protein